MCKIVSMKNVAVVERGEVVGIGVGNRDWSAIFNGFTHMQRQYLSLVMMGETHAKAIKAIGVKYETVKNWRCDGNFRELEEGHDLHKRELMPQVALHYAATLNVKSLMVANQLLDFYSKKRFGNLRQFELYGLIKVLELGAKVTHVDGDLKEGYEEIIFKLRRRAVGEVKGDEVLRKITEGVQSVVNDGGE